MVCQDDISIWFRRARGSERIEVLCGLLQLCNPLELRFIGTCVEDLAKKDFVSLREDELKANDTAQLRMLSEGSIFDDKTRSKLLFSVSLLYSLNTVCAHALYEVLSHIQAEILQHQAYCMDSKSHLQNPSIVDDILLLFTMSTNHPAFTFSERQQLYAIFKNVERLIAEFLAKLAPPVENSSQVESPCVDTPCSIPQANPTVTSSVSLPLSPSSSASIDSKSNHVDEKPSSTSPPAKPMHVKSIEMKGSQPSKHSRKTEFSIQVTWSNAEVTVVSRTYQELHSFHLRLLKLFPKESNAHKLDRVLPFFPQDNRLHGSHPREVLEALRKYFRQLSATPYIRSHHLAEFFSNEVKSQQQNVKTGSHPSGSSTSQEGATNDVPLLSVCSSISSESTADTHPAKCTLVSTKVSQRHAYSHPTPPSPSPPLCMPSPVTSPVQCSSSYWDPSADDSEPSIDEWLKKIRLHKYSTTLSKYTWLQLCKLSDRDLTNEGLTQGAKKKLISEIHKLRDGQKNGVVVGVNRLSPTGIPSSLSPQWSNNSTASSPQPRSDGHNLDSIDSSCSEYSSPPRSPNHASEDCKDEAKCVSSAYVSMEPKCSPGVMEAPPPLPPPPPYVPHFPGNVRLPPNIHFMAPRPMLRSPRLPMQRPPLMMNNKGCSSPDHTSNSPGCIKSSISCPQIQEAIASDHYKFSTNGPLMGTSLVCPRPSSLAAPSSTHMTSASPPLTVSTDTSSPPTPRHTPPLTSTPSECTMCGHCGQSRPMHPPPMQFTAGGMWPGMPLPMMHHMPPNGLPFVSPEVLFNNQANFVMQQHRPPPPLPHNGAGLLGQHPMAAPTSASHYPMHATQPGLLMGQLMHPVFTKMNKGPMCCNCGANGHRGTECKESTFDMMTRSGQYHLNMAPKSESE